METVSPAFFYIFGGLAVLATALMIFRVNPVASALCLVFSLFCVAGLYVLLHAPFVAVLQVLVYAGAIMVLFVFVIMLLKLKDTDMQEDRVTGGRLLVALMGVGFACLLGFQFLKVKVHEFAAVKTVFGAAEPVGRLMLTKYLIPFELISILLLVAIIGVVLLGKRDA